MVETWYWKLSFRAKLGQGLMSGDYSAPPPKDADEKLMVSMWVGVMSGDYSAPPPKDADESC